MRRPFNSPHMSAGFFATAVAAAAIIPVSVRAAGPATVTVGNPSGSTTAYVTPMRQLQTTIIAPINVVSATGLVESGGTCETVYTPPPGKGIVVTQITYDLGSGAQGTESNVELVPGCNSPEDYADTVQAHEEKSHTFPTGLPMPDVTLANFGPTPIYITLSGYLIPATQLPPQVPQNPATMKRVPRR